MKRERNLCPPHNFVPLVTGLSAKTAVVVCMKKLNFLLDFYDFLFCRFRYKTALYRAEVEIVTSSDKVTSFCEDVCHRLQICPNLLSLAPLDGSPCPKKCHLMSKTNISTGNDHFSYMNLLK